MDLQVLERETFLAHAGLLQHARDAGFSGRPLARNRCRPRSANPGRRSCRTASVAIPRPQEAGSARHYISPSFDAREIATPHGSHDRESLSRRSPAPAISTHSPATPPSNRAGTSRSPRARKRKEHTARHVHARAVRRRFRPLPACAVRPRRDQRRSRTANNDCPNGGRTASSRRDITGTTTSSKNAICRADCSRRRKMCELAHQAKKPAVFR